MTKSALKALFILKIILVAAASVDKAAVGQDLDNSVGDGVEDLVVVRGEKNITFKGAHTVVNGGNILKVKVVGGLIDNKHIRAEHHHS